MRVVLRLAQIAALLILLGMGSCSLHSGINYQGYSSGDGSLEVGFGVVALACAALVFRRWFWAASVAVEAAHLTSPQRSGGSVGSSMAKVFNDYRRAKFESRLDEYLAIITDRLQEALGNQDVPPLTVAHSELETFREYAAKLPDQMMEETLSDLQEWFASLEELGMREEMVAIVRQGYQADSQAVMFAGVAVFNERAGALARADAEWHAQNPKRAQHFPVQ